MRARRRLRPLIGAVATIAMALAQVATASPRAAHVRPAIDTDEGGLWSAADKAEAGAKASAELDSDPAINAYVHDIACKVAAEYCDEMRLYVLDRPYFNAAMAPNGYMEVWSGLLLRSEDEAQLSFVLGHEISHFAQSHSIQAWRTTKERTNVGMLLMFVSAPFGGALVGELLYLGAVSSLFSYSREQEFDADRLGFERATKAGYDAPSAAVLWRNLTGETQASDFEKVRTSETRASVFATHPVTTDRIKALDAMAQGRAPGDGLDRKAYRARIRPHLNAWLRDDLRRRDFGETLNLLDRLAAEGEDLGLVGYFKGEAYRLRRSEGDSDRAIKAYTDAAAYADAPPSTWRELGDLYGRGHDAAKARDAYQAYLQRAPDAQDRWLVEASLKSLDQPGTP